MSTLPFAIKMLVEVRAKDEGGFENEVLYHQSVTASINYDPLGEGYNQETLLDQLELPEVPGLYSVWIVGHIHFTEYDGPEGVEHDENVYVDTSEVSPATEYERTAMEVQYDCDLPDSELRAFFTTEAPAKASPEDIAKAVSLLQSAVPIPNSHWPDQPVTTKTKEQ